MRNECRIALVSLEENHKIVTSNGQGKRLAESQSA